MSDSSIERIGAADARALLEAGDAVAVDVREPHELAASGKVPGALAIPRATIGERADPGSPRHEPALDPGKSVIVYCGAGARADAAGRTLKQLGFEKVYNLGGLKDWVAAGFPVER